MYLSRAAGKADPCVGFFAADAIDGGYDHLPRKQLLTANQQVELEAEEDGYKWPVNS